MQDRGLTNQSHVAQFDRFVYYLHILPRVDMAFSKSESLPSLVLTFCTYLPDLDQVKPST